MDDEQRDLMFRFDARLEGAVLRFATHVKGMRRPGAFYSGPEEKLTAANVQPPLFVRFSSGKLNILLGRNGSGKSRLLDALQTWDGSGSAFPSASLLFSIPDSATHELWEAEVSEALGSSWLAEQSEHVEPWVVLDSIAKPPIMTDLRAAFDGLGPEQQISALRMTTDDVLSFFGCTEDEIVAWAERSRSRSQLEAWSFGTPFGPASWWIRDLAPEFLVKGASSLPINLGEPSMPEPGSAVQITSGQEWFNQPNLRDLVAPAVREFIESATLVECVASGTFRLLAPRPDSGPLRTMVEEIRHGTLENDWPWLAQSFPGGLFESVELEGVPYVASFALHGPARSLVDVYDVSPNGESEARLGEVTTELFDHLLSVRLLTDGGEAAYVVEGLQRTRQLISDVADQLRQSQIGVSDLMLDWPPSPEKWLGNSENGSFRSLGLPSSIAPRLLWRDTATGEWLDTSLASEGQRQVVALFLRLGLIRARRGSSSSSHVLLLGDEFDRNLHPTAASAVLEILSAQLLEVPGVSVIVSTHNVSSVTGPSLRSSGRIFARREHDGFYYYGSLESPIEIVSEILGASFLDALRLKKLYLVVEGNHDEYVIGDLLEHQLPDLGGIEIVNPHGLYGWSGTFANALRFLDAPILFVHDKRDQTFEDEWSRCRKHFLESGFLPPWPSGPFFPGGPQPSSDRTRFFDMYGDIRKRKMQRKSLKSDTELKSLLDLLRNSVFEREPAQTLRVNFFGFDCDDIVDLLPIKHFPKAASEYRTWEDAHADFDLRLPKAGGDYFKNEMGVNDKTVREAVAKNRDSVHPELARLLKVIRRLLES